MKNHDLTNDAETMAADDIFFDALAFDTEEMQKAYVKSACADNDKLRRQVDALLASLPDAEHFFASESLPTISARDLFDTLANFPRPSES